MHGKTISTKLSYLQHLNSDHDQGKLGRPSVNETLVSKHVVHWLLIEADSKLGFQGARPPLGARDFS